MACSQSTQSTSQLNELIETPSIGDKIDSLNGVHVYYNGKIYTHSQGKHFAPNQYYYGQKGQCVEFVKRYYHDALAHSMPNVWGNAIDFFDQKTKHGQLNSDRGLIQFYHGENERPQVNDLIVFPITKYGHVAIISAIGEDYIEIIQQNLGTKTREIFPLEVQLHELENGSTEKVWFIRSKIRPLGWLRKP